MLWLVSESWSSSWVRSVTKTTFHFESDGMAVHLPHHEHHGQGFARALGVPDDAAALAGALAFQEALHRQLDGAELLVAPHDLDRLALVVGGEQGEGADDVEQVVPVEHPGDEALLVVGAAAAVVQIVHRTGIRVRPAVEVLFAVGGDGAELGLLPAGGDDELVVVKERRAALAFGAALLAVAEELVDGLGDRRPSPSAICTRSPRPAGRSGTGRCPGRCGAPCRGCAP